MAAQLSEITPPLTAAANLSIVAAALLIEAAAGYPAWIFRLWRHPVVWIGALIGRCDRILNRRASRSNGILAIILVVLSAALPTWLVQRLVPPWLAAVMASSLLTQRSLFSHVRAVADGLEREALEGGRRAVAHIVGRDPASLDAAGVTRAAIESLAENFSDGVVAPALWGALLGLTGMAAYKAVNTADSMIGHRTPRHERFGWAAARLDDLVNLPAARLAALWLILAALIHPRADAKAAARAAWRDAANHRSPNAGWPEAAMAGALGLRLAGPRVYGAVRVSDAWMGDGRPDATVADLRAALSLYRLACAIQIAAVIGLAVIVRD